MKRLLYLSCAGVVVCQSLLDKSLGGSHYIHSNLDNGAMNSLLRGSEMLTKSVENTGAVQLQQRVHLTHLHDGDLQLNIEEPFQAFIQLREDSDDEDKDGKDVKDEDEEDKLIDTAEQSILLATVYLSAVFANPSNTRIIYIYIDKDDPNDLVQGRIMLNGKMTDVDCDCSNHWQTDLLDVNVVRCNKPTKFMIQRIDGSRKVTINDHTYITSLS